MALVFRFSLKNDEMGEGIGRKRKSTLMSQEDQTPPRRGKILRKLLTDLKPRDAKITKPRKLRGSNGRSSHRKARTILSWLIDNNVILPLAKVYYRNKTGTPLMRGRATRDGILCDCCSRVFALTAFEAHAGSTNHRPAAFIMLDDGSGRSLSDCQKQVHDDSMSIIKVSKVQTPGTHHVDKGLSSSQQRESCDRICSLCLDGSGELIFCEQCPSAFHVRCLGLKEAPKGHWFCRSCCCGICGNGHLFERSCLTCQQCERRFHAICLKMKRKSSDWKNCQTGKSWFCSQSCEKLFSGLQKLRGRSIPVGNNLSWTLLKSEDDDRSAKNDENHQSKLSAALDVMHECFEPGIDFYTGRDVAEDVIFSRGSKLKRVDCKGFYTVILEEDGDLATVATVRVHGDKVAEMPFVATRFRHRRRGMCRVLMDELEKNLRIFGVEKLVLPSVRSALETWTNNFGFMEMTGEDRSRFLHYSFLNFHGTVMCQKFL